MSFEWKVSNIPVANIEFIVEFILISWLYVLFCPPLKKLISIAVPCSIIFFIINSIYLQPIGTYQNFNRLIVSLLIIAYSIIYDIHLVRNLPADNLWRYGPFWIVAAFLCGFTLNLFIFALSNYVFRELPKEMAIVFWMFHGFNDLLKNVLLAVGIYYVSDSKSSVIRRVSYI
jgi:hypothetical protein